MGWDWDHSLLELNSITIAVPINYGLNKLCSNKLWSQSKHSRSNNEHRPTSPPQSFGDGLLFLGESVGWGDPQLILISGNLRIQTFGPKIWENRGGSSNIQCLFQPAWDLLRVPARWLSSIVTSKETDPWNLWISKIGDMGWLIWKIYTTWCGSRILFFCRDPGATAQVWATTSRAFIPLWSIFLTQTCQVQLPKMAASTCHRNIIW